MILSTGRSDEVGHRPTSSSGKTCIRTRPCTRGRVISWPAHSSAWACTQLGGGDPEVGARCCTKNQIFGAVSCTKFWKFGATCCTKYQDVGATSCTKFLIFGARCCTRPTDAPNTLHQTVWSQNSIKLEGGLDLR